MASQRSTTAVLVVDDDEDIRETLAQVLMDEGFTVASAENGQDALDYLEGHEAPCVIVLDLMMPVMTGAEFRAKQLAEPRFASIPVIVLSAADRGGAIANTLRASAFIAKPPSMDLIVETVARYC
jgi:CheY-like chemotaxis protein